ncbi:transposase [Globicatella sulfidifaciens]|uniref:transposase n=1 Tax=Globicatella sulfidifaciens TaxID=136093 RepID=UPI0023F02BA4|nr:transposase [Globicatella sulfidifaciens]
MYTYESYNPKTAHSSTKSGYKADTSADILQYNPVLLTFASDEPLASQPTISRFWDRISEETIEDLQKLNQVLIDQARLVHNDTNLIIDLDSTHSDTFGNQELSDYNAHYGTTGYHPIVAFDGLKEKAKRIIFNIIRG